MILKPPAGVEEIVAITNDFECGNSKYITSFELQSFDDLEDTYLGFVWR